MSKTPINFVEKEVNLKNIKMPSPTKRKYLNWLLFSEKTDKKTPLEIVEKQKELVKKGLLEIQNFNSIFERNEKANQSNFGWVDLNNLNIAMIL
jgi:Cu2+-containing amine oxidase